MAQGNPGWQLGRRIAPPRFIAFAVLMIAGTLAAAPGFGLGWGRALMAGFDMASLVFLASPWPLLADESKALALTGLVMIVIPVAIASELAGRRPPARAAARAVK